MSSEKRTAPRYFVMASLPGQLDGRDVEVVDISMKGARVQVTEAVGIGATMRFTLKCSGAAVVIPVTVQWCELAALSLHDGEEDRFFCGLEFERPVPVVRHLVEDMLAAHDVTAIEDQRRAERYRITSQLTASFGELKSARVLDVSVSGARIGTDSPLTPGETKALCFRITGGDTPVDVPATVVWSKPAERKGRFEAGLRIDGVEDWLRAVIDELALRDSVVVDHGSLRRKFDPFASKGQAGLLSIIR